MRFSVISIFPEMIRSFLNFGLIAKALEKNLIQVGVVDLRDFALNKHRKVDDRPFGGGAGMVMMPGPLLAAVEHIKKIEPGRVILFSAYGPVLNQKRVKELIKESHLILVCGRYEGVDQRFIDLAVDEEISLGEYVLMGGEVAAEALLEASSRLMAGVVGNPESVETDTFYHENQWAFPQYTQPREFKRLSVPDILISGNHEDIRKWRQQNQKRRK